MWLILDRSDRLISYLRFGADIYSLGNRRSLNARSSVYLTKIQTLFAPDSKAIPGSIVTWLGKIYLLGSIAK